jgi:hypothetical protein
MGFSGFLGGKSAPPISACANQVSCRTTAQRTDDVGG